MANVNQFGVCELREDELMEVDGGGYWSDTWDDFKDVCSKAFDAATATFVGTVAATKSVSTAAVAAGYAALGAADVESYHEAAEDLGFEPQD